jgi:hypothetical protein
MVRIWLKGNKMADMVFPYYSRLSRKQKTIYRRSDVITSIPLSASDRLKSMVSTLETSLLEQDREMTERSASQVIDALIEQLQKVPPVHTRVLAARPSNDRGELHGLYEPADTNKQACITVWMRTTKHKKVVAFRTFLRTLIHEFCHHLDYELLGLEDSFHTEGFFKRESSLFKQLMLST